VDCSVVCDNFVPGSMFLMIREGVASKYVFFKELVPVEEINILPAWTNHLLLRC
jgi:hypothetical protein